MSLADATAPGRDRAADAPPAKAGARVRDPRLDFYRGIAMFIILLAHTPGNPWTRWIPARFGFSDATEMFVFCSGMASAIAFGAVFEGRGWLLGTVRTGFRVWQVYWAHIGLFFAVAAFLAAIDQTGAYDTVYIGTLNLWRFFSEPGPQLVGLFTLTYVPNYFDILPMYMVILAMMPAFIALRRLHPVAPFAATIAVWLAAQGPLMEMLGLPSLALPAEPWSDREWFFNPFGWQLVFFTGFALMRGWIPAPPRTPALIGAAVAVVLVSMYYSDVGTRTLSVACTPDPAVDSDLCPREWRFDNRVLFAKTDFGPLRYVHFLALAYLGFVLAGDGGARLRPAGAGLAARAWRGLVGVITRVGQQSLAVFLVSMFLARVTGFVWDNTGVTPASVTLGNVSGFAILIAAAYGVGWVKSQPWKRSATG